MCKNKDKKAERHNKMLARHAQAKIDRLGLVEDKSLVRSGLAPFETMQVGRGKAKRAIMFNRSVNPNKDFFFYKKGDKPKHKKGTSFKPLVEAGFYDQQTGKKLF